MRYTLLHPGLRFFMKYASHNTTAFSDKEIIERVLLGNSELFGVLFDRYSKKVFGYLWHIAGRKEDCEDFLQDTFYKAYVNLRYCRERERFPSWLFAIAHNVAISSAKKLKSLYTREVLEGNAANLELHAADEDDTSAAIAFMRREESESVQRALADMPLHYKETITLFYYNEFSIEEIAEVLGISQNTVKTRLHRGRKYLARELERTEQAEADRIATLHPKTSHTSI